VDTVLDDPQRRGPVLELFAGIDADVHAPLAAAGAEPLGLGQRVVVDLARQVRRQSPAAMRPRPPWGRLGHHRHRHGAFGCGRRRVEQQRLVGIIAFATRAVQAPQQAVEAVAQLGVVALAGAQADSQFHDQALERGDVIGQVCGVNGEGHRVHAY
jgi:hypothetical protein